MPIFDLPLELAAVVGACLIGLVHIGAQSFSYKGQVGNPYSMGPRDNETPAAGLAGRLQRAQRNFGETFPLFVAAVAVVEFADRAGPVSAAGCGLYLVARALYIPAYVSGLPWVRTVMWQIATIGIVVLLVAACLP